MSAGWGQLEGKARVRRLEKADLTHDAACELVDQMSRDAALAAHAHQEMQEQIRLLRKRTSEFEEIAKLQEENAKLASDNCTWGELYGYTAWTFISVVALRIAFQM